MDCPKKCATDALLGPSLPYYTENSAELPIELFVKLLSKYEYDDIVG